MMAGKEIFSVPVVFADRFFMSEKSLAEKRIGGAALDVFAEEPITGHHPLKKMENVVLSPHILAMTQEARPPCALQ